MEEFDKCDYERGPSPVLITENLHSPQIDFVDNGSYL